MTTLTNKPITGFKYDPKRPTPLRYGYAKQAELGFCYCDSLGNPIPTQHMGQEKYSEICKKVEKLCEPFFNHLRRIFANDPRDMDVFLDYMAFKMQYPSVKVRWAIVLAGEQGVGKDVSIDACWKAYGEDKVRNVAPANIMSDFNDYLANTLLLRISEAADLGEVNRWTFNERVKVIIAGHPDLMQVNPKYGFKYWLHMCHGTIITTNHLDDGFFISERDRRYYVIKCATWQELGMNVSEGNAYFDELFNWFNTPNEMNYNGYELIGMYLYYYRNVEKFQYSTCPEPTKAKLEAMQESNSLPLWFLDGIAEYVEAIEGCNSNHSDSSLYQIVQDNPIIIRTRTLSEILDSHSDTNGVGKITGAKLAAFLRKMGYVRLSSCNTRCWRFSNRKPETFYYNASLINAQKATDVVHCNGEQFTKDLDNFNSSSF